MNSSETNGNMGRVAGVFVRLARVTAVVLILTSSFALAWAASRTNESRAEIQVKPPQPRLLHTKPPSMRHGQRAAHHPTRQAVKSHKHGQQSAHWTGTHKGNSTSRKRGNQSQPDTTPTPTPEETPTPSPELAPDSSPIGTPLSSDVDQPSTPR
jgi:hypothetical protein